MDLNDKNLLYKIVRARDKRYDGRFYCGVHTTGIYCRPICPARPKLQNISFYRSAAEAEKAGLRACLRCRPDLAPNSVQWNGTAAVVGRALTMISRGEADDYSVDQFAEKLGISDRHLRRLFDEHVGVSPIEVTTSKRLHLAKQLLTQSSLPITEIAFASGYQSIRRFNEAFKDRFRVSPTHFRDTKEAQAEKRPGFIHIEIPVIAPFDWDNIFDFLQRHGTAGVESFTNNRYRRNIADGALEIAFDAKKNQLLAAISLPDPMQLREIIERIRDLFDTRLNPHAHLADLNSRCTIAKCYRQQLGLRIPGGWDPFETAVGIVLGQLVSVEQGRLKMRKLVDQFGTEISNPTFAECTRLFPSAGVLAAQSLKEIGITKVREHALRELARLVADKKIDLSRSTDIDKTKERLLAIKGIGPWTVEMIAMRCLGDANAFPATDLIIQRALKRHDKEKGDWSPWNAYITMALWKKYAASLSAKKSARRWE